MACRGHSSSKRQAKLVVHEVPIDLSPLELKDETRWLTKINNKMHSLIVITVKGETEKQSIKQSGLSVRVMLLKVENRQSSTTESKCLNCFHYRYHKTFCNRSAKRVYYAGEYLQTLYTARADSLSQASMYPKGAPSAIQ
ncbi:hypothetical protein GcC1_172005 [Golovinomyces cichoracearum]|uniref:Uncharacterized protein n=1 Tax=Golovinomyces cichoracearum TaxID=62708 RepID=A0A420HQU9_9PEZI|nr:hypothetical protein GcC1_172005 [Golovinomyces cichoracearum]